MSDPNFDDDEAVLAAARAGFVEEAAQLLSQFESALLGMESDPGDAELLNAAFRAAHTIKGTAGLFGLEHVVGFTHEVETLLESMRAGECSPTEASVALLLRSRDQIERLLENPNGDLDPQLASDGELLATELRQVHLGEGVAANLSASDVPAAEPRSFGGAQGWRITARFGRDALRCGLDPQSFLRYLTTVGEVRQTRLIDEAVPDFESLEPESCYIGFSTELIGEVDYETVERVFEFAIEDCELNIEALDSDPVADASGVAIEAKADASSSPAAAPVEASAVEAASSMAGPEQPLEPAPGDASPPERRAAGGERRSGGGDRRAEGSRFVRVQADKLDALIDLIGELVIASSGAQIAAQQEGSAVFGEAAMRIRNLVEAARDGALSLRMVPIGETFARFHRVVRDVSKSLGKEIELQVTGGDTELDKSMVEVIADPLMHLVRNSLDHGIESPDDRQATGKARKGRLALNAYHESGVIVIEVSDDGRGLNRDKILAKATERGIVRPDQTLSDHEIYQLICQPGFSTADKVSDISGRGVGMDVVKRSIESLRGQMLLASTAGKGSTTQIRLPLTLAIIDGFLCTVDDVHYVVPLETVSECIETPKDCHGNGVAGYFDLRGEVLPYLNVRAFLGHEVTDRSRQSMIVVKAHGARIGLLVNRLLGEYQTVIKPLGPLFQDLKGIAGSTILGSGDVALILDVANLVGRAEETVRKCRGSAMSTPLGVSVTEHGKESEK